MVKIPSPDPIELLIRIRYSSSGLIDVPRKRNGSLSDWLEKPRAEIEAYRVELQSKDADELQELLRSEKERQKSELAARRSKEDAKQFFNESQAEADFDHYCKAATWTLDECVALSLGREPLWVNWSAIERLVAVSDFARTYERRRDLVRRAKLAGQLCDPVAPSIFLTWAKEKEFDLPPELLPTAVDHGISLQGWKELHESLKKRYSSDMDEVLSKHKKITSDLRTTYKRDVDALTERLTAAQRELSEYRKAALQAESRIEAQQNEARPLKTRERENLQLIAFLGAVRGYGYDPDGRNKAAARIENDTDTLSLRLSDDTVRNHLKRALEFIPPNWQGRLNLKPYSDKP